MVSDAKQVKKYPCAEKSILPKSGRTARRKTNVPQGYGIISINMEKTSEVHAGTNDDAWHEKRLPYLPEDFESASGMGRIPDMQIPHLAGNVCNHPYQPYSRRNYSPSGSLSNAAWSGIACKRQHVIPNRPLLDTLIIEPDLLKVSVLCGAPCPGLSG